MRRFALVLLIALSSPLLMGAAPSLFPAPLQIELSAADRDALDAISAYLNGIHTLKGNFTQTDPNGATEEGTFYISKPGRMRFEYNPPVPTLVVADGRTVAVVNRRLNTVDRYPLSETPLGIILNNTIDIRHDPALVSVTREPGVFVINLRASRKQSKSNISLTFSAPEYELRQWTVIDNQGLSTTTALSNLQPGATLSPSLFILPDRNPFSHRRQD